MTVSNLRHERRDDATARGRASFDRPSPHCHTMLLSASRREDREAVNQWVAAALRRGERAVCLFDPVGASVEDLSSQLLGAGTARAAIASGQVLLLDAARLRTASGDPWAGPGERLAALVERVGDGRPVNVTADEAALRRCLRDGEELAELEDALDRLAERSSVRALCRYREPDGPGRRRGSTCVHHRAVLDPLAQIERTGDTLRLGGEIDVRNLDRVQALLAAALADGVRRLDLSGLRFCCAAGLATLARIAGREDDPRRVALVDPTPAVSRLLDLIRRR